MNTSQNTPQNTTTGTGWDDWGLDAPTPIEDDGQDDDPEREVTAIWWHVVLAAAFVLAVLTAVVFLAARAGSSPEPAPVQRSSFTDQFGRQCTQVRAGDAVALDCDAKPLESRLGSALSGLGQ